MAVRSWRLVGIWSVLVCLSMVPLGVLPAPARAAGGYTSWALRSQGEGYILLGHSYDYTASSGIQVYGTAHYISAGVDTWNLQFAAANGADLEIGKTYAAGGDVVPGVGPWLQFTGDGRGCSATSTFTVQELTTDTTGQVQSLRMTFEQHCYDDPGVADFGSLAWNASSPAMVLPPALTMRLGAREVGYRKPLTVQAHLSPDSPRRELGIYLVPRGGPDQLLRTGTVDALGNLTTTVRPTESGVVEVRFDGGGQFPDRDRQRPRLRDREGAQSPGGRVGTPWALSALPGFADGCDRRAAAPEPPR